MLAQTAPAGAVEPATITWKNIGPGGGGWIPCVAVSPHDSKVVYAGCDVGGFFKSTDAGGTWRICNTGLRGYYVECILPHPRDPKIILIGTQDGMHKSTDGGESWQWLGKGFPPREAGSFSAPIGAVAMDPTNPDTLYAGIGRPRFGKSGHGRVYRSTDGGAHWSIANVGGGGMDKEAIVSDLLVCPTKPQRLFAATNKGFYRSEDSAATWQRVETGLPHEHVRRIAICQSRPEMMYLTLRSTPGQTPWQGGVYRSDDGGQTWTPRSQGLAKLVGQPGKPAPMTSNVDRLIVHPENPDIVYAGDTAWVSAGIYRTADGGQSWQRMTDTRTNLDLGLHKTGPTVFGLAIDPRAPDTVWFSTSMHIFRSTDAGKHWEQMYSHRLERPQGAPESAAGYWSTSGLETLCVANVVIHPRDAKRLFVCYADCGLMQSFDGGRSFTPTVQGMPHHDDVVTVAFDPANPKIIYAGSGTTDRGEICRSYDNGFTWRVVGQPQTGLPNGAIVNITVDADSTPDARRIYACVNRHGIFCSEDGGASWQARNNGLPNKSVRALVQHPREPKVLFALLAGGGGDQGGVFRSDDRGHTWRRLSSAFSCPDARALAIAPSDPQRLYVSARKTFASNRKTYPGGVFASDDGGITWQQVLDDSLIQTLAVDVHDAGVLYAGSAEHPYHDDAIGRGVLRSRDGGRTWESLNSPSLTCRNIRSLTLDSRAPSRLIVGTDGNGVFVATIPPSSQP
jgi:photosystem II stability/assembly factor-like uncharacterized protein